MSKFFKQIRSEVLQQLMEEQLIQEGVYDPNIFKAFFLAGGPGSGKSYVVKKTTKFAGGLRMVNSDDVFEKMLKDAGLDTTPEDIFSDQGQEIRGRAKSVTKKRQQNFIDGRLGLILDGTGKDYDKIANQSGALKGLGYDTYMIFVNTSLDVAQERNKMRKRTLPEKEVEMMWNQVQQNMGKFQRHFGSKNFIIVDNNDAGEDIFKQVEKRIRARLRDPIKNHIAKQWIASELEKKKRD